MVQPRARALLYILFSSSFTATPVHVIQRAITENACLGSNTESWSSHTHLRHRSESFSLSEDRRSGRGNAVPGAFSDFFMMR